MGKLFIPSDLLQSKIARVLNAVHKAGLELVPENPTGSDLPPIVPRS